MKSIIKLIIAALVIHGTWRAGAVYWQYHQFKDELQQLAQFSGNRSENELVGRVGEVANRLQVRVEPQRIAARREDNRTFIDASYDVRIELLPRYYYPWTFTVHAEAFTIGVK